MGAWIRRNGKRIFKVFDDISRLRVSVYAGNAGFFVLLAIFPALMLVMSVIRYTGLDINLLTDMLEGFIPSALMSGAKRTMALGRNSAVKMMMTVEIRVSIR